MTSVAPPCRHRHCHASLRTGTLGAMATSSGARDHLPTEQRNPASMELDRLDTTAAVELFLYAGFIVGFCFLWLHFTVWSQSEPVAKEPFYTTLPGVDMKHLPPAKADAVLKKLNVRRCHCECMRSVASCRNHHDSCTESIVAAQNEIDAARGR